MYKLHPVAKLTSEFQSNIINKVIADLCIMAAIPVGVVMDKNRVNQVCLSSFRADSHFMGYDVVLRHTLPIHGAQLLIGTFLEQ